MEPAKLIVPDRVEPRERAVATVPAAVDPNATPMQMLAIMTQRGVSMADLKDLVALAKDWEAGQARKAFVLALANFKKNPPKVIKDMDNKQYGSKYSSLPNLVNTVNVSLGEHGLNAIWSLKQSDKNIEVTCILSHVLGHSESVMLSSPPDVSGAKNPLQQIKSTITYLEGATFQAITGIVASNEGNDDGNASGKAPPKQAVVPEGFENWSLDMEALADEGTARLQDAWKKAPAEFRRHVVQAEGSWWAAMKSKAAKVKVP